MTECSSFNNKAFDTLFHIKVYDLRINSRVDFEKRYICIAVSLRCKRYFFLSLRNIYLWMSILDSPVRVYFCKRSIIDGLECISTSRMHLTNFCSAMCKAEGII